MLLVLTAYANYYPSQPEISTAILTKKLLVESHMGYMGHFYY